MKKLNPLFILLLAFLISCTSVQHISKVKVSYDVPGNASNQATDAEINQMILPYKVQLDEKMGEVLVNVATEMTKAQPESTMGNWLTDAMMAASEREGYHADFAVHNYGGMRVPVITVGPLTMGELYEFSPFDNTLMIVDAPGNIVDSLFRFVATKDGWPVSNNIRMVMKNKNLISLTINGQPLDVNKTYKIAVPDYVANGGDNTAFMIGLKRLQTGLLVRNILAQYAKELAKDGKDINVTLQGRIKIQTP